MNQTAGETRVRTFWRIVFVAALAATQLAFTLPDLRRVWQPLGGLGYVSNYDGIVTTVVANSSAANAGLKPGDRIDLADTDPSYRMAATNAITLYPGQEVQIAIFREGQKRLITIVSQPAYSEISSRSFMVVREVAGLVFIVVGAFLVLVRPSVTTWAFYIFCVGFDPSPSLIFLVAGPPALSVVWLSIWTLFGAAGYIGLLVFALTFVHRDIAGWRKTTLRLSPIIFFIFTSLSIYAVVGANWYGWRADTAFKVLTGLEVAAAVVSFGAFVDTYLVALGSDKQRIRWVIVSFVVAAVANSIDIAIGYMSNATSPALYLLYSTLKLSILLVPLTVAYAVIKHRIIDVSFVISRTLVYGILTTLLVGAFSVVDWFFADFLGLARLGTVAGVGAAVAFGIWFNSLHRRVDTFIDATFFRQRHAAERQLARNAAALPFASATQAIAHSLVAEPVQALSLASAALFRRDRDGEFVREESVGWGPADLKRLDADDEHLKMLLLAENAPLSLDDHRWRTEDVPSGAGRPILGLPIVVRRELVALALYGAHAHGEALDPDEVKAIAGLASGAAAAYDHLVAQDLRREVDAMREKVASLESALATQMRPA